MSNPLGYDLIRKALATLTLLLLLPVLPLLAAGAIIAGMTLWVTIVAFTLGSASIRVLWPKAET